MPKRAGKAATRRARQRPPRRPIPPSPTPSSTTTGAGSAAATPVPPVGTPDARQATSLDPPRRVTPPLYSSAGSSLTERQRADYHYVEQDLRNIGILTVVMVVLLFVAWFAFRSLGIIS